MKKISLVHFFFSSSLANVSTIMLNLSLNLPNNNSSRFQSYAPFKTSDKVDIKEKKRPVAKYTNFQVQCQPKLACL